MGEGKYSILRYIPDLVREEPVNLGVLLEAPVGVFFRTVEDIQEIRYWPSGSDREFLSDALKSFKKDFDDQGDMFDFAKNVKLMDIYEHWLNELQITNPRPIEIADVSEQLRLLFQRFVHIDPRQRQQTITKSQVHAKVRGYFNTFALSAYVQHEVEYMLRRFELPIRVDHIYRNARQHLIQDFSFASGTLSENEADIDAWAFRCDSIIGEESSVHLGAFVYSPSREDPLLSRAHRILNSVNCEVVHVDDQPSVTDFFSTLVHN